MGSISLYYRRLFPHACFSRWMDLNDFKNREISFTLAGDRYIRYLSFAHYKEFYRMLLDKRPIRLNLGAVYSFEPRYKTQLGEGEVFKPIMRELVIDIDVTDYDDIRICCTGSNICEKCWKFMSIACQVLDESLKDDFGCKNLMWVFSGRRGIHCWVADKFMSDLNKEGRSAVVEYYNRVKGGRKKSKKVELPDSEKVHPFLLKAINIIDKYFLTIISEQNVLGDKQLDNFLSIIDVTARNTVKEELIKYKTSEERWFALLNIIEQKCVPDSKCLVEIIKLQYGYPRIDVNVSKDLGHLLKSPFTVHPSTGKVSVPFDAKLVDQFDPNHVPTLTTLTNELKSAYCDKNEELKTDRQDLRLYEDYKKTSLLPYIDIFEGFVKKLQEKK